MSGIRPPALRSELWDSELRVPLVDEQLVLQREAHSLALSCTTLFITESLSAGLLAVWTN